MTDIFDEVDEILGDVDSVVEDPTAHEVESNFNESELQDIMAEIESLEKDFDEEPVTASAETPVRKTQLQEEIEREIAMSQEVSEEVKEELIAQVETETEVETETFVEEPKILSFEKKAEPIVTPVAPMSKSSEISFAAQGQMNLNLSFKVGEETATLSVDPVLGLVVTMKGVELCISENEGCKVTMENGVNFTIPLTTAHSTSKKKAA